LHAPVFAGAIRGFAMTEKSADKHAHRAADAEPADSGRRAPHRAVLAASTSEPEHARVGRRRGAAARTGKTVRRIGA
jgi:hypothetical protein